jgi:hypothetical protein
VIEAITLYLAGGEENAAEQRPTFSGRVGELRVLVSG